MFQEDVQLTAVKRKFTVLFQISTKSGIPTNGCVRKCLDVSLLKFFTCYFGGARSKGFATLRNVSKLQFFDKIGHAKSVGFRLYSAI